MIYQFSKLRRKVGAAEGFRTGVLEKHERILLETLFPLRAPQERALCFLPFLGFGWSRACWMSWPSWLGNRRRNIAWFSYKWI